jgi:hypothetical protein
MAARGRHSLMSTLILPTTSFSLNSTALLGGRRSGQVHYPEVSNYAEGKQQAKAPLPPNAVRESRERGCGEGQNRVAVKSKLIRLVSVE